MEFGIIHLIYNPNHIANNLGSQDSDLTLFDTKHMYLIAELHTCTYPFVLIILLELK